MMIFQKNVMITARYTCGYNYNFDCYNNCVTSMGQTGLVDKCMDKCKY